MAALWGVSFWEVYSGAYELEIAADRRYILKKNPFSRTEVHSKKETAWDNDKRQRNEYLTDYARRINNQTDYCLLLSK